MTLDTNSDGTPLPPPQPLTERPTVAAADSGYDTPGAPASARGGRFKSELVAGGSVQDLSDDELVGGWRAAIAMGILVALLVWLGSANIWYLVFVVGLIISIALHEAGHFFAAKWSGMKVTQAFLFVGPRLWSFRRGETEYGVRALPLGAFVRIVGMHKIDETDPEDEPRSYREQSFPKRMLTISGGSIMHMLLAIVLLFASYLMQGEITDQREDRVVVGSAPIELPAGQAGVLADDEILEVDGVAISSSTQLGDVVRSNEPADFVDVVVLRDGVEQTITVGLGANTNEGDPNFGSALLGVSTFQPVLYEEHGVVGSAVNAVTDIFPAAWESTKGVVRVINPVNIFTHLTGDNDDLASRPTTLYGVTTISDDVGESTGLAGMLYLLAVLNVFVGVFNMFPLLPLDGGHAAVAIYERIQEARRGDGRRYFADVERLMPFAVGVVMLLATLMFAGLYLDITRPI